MAFLLLKFCLLVCLLFKIACFKIASMKSKREKQAMPANHIVCTPIQRGRSYRVTGAGLDISVIAKHPCDAICIALSFSGVLPC